MTNMKYFYGVVSIAVFFGVLAVVLNYMQGTL